MARELTISGRTGWFRKNSTVHAITDRVTFRTYGALSGRMCEYMPYAGQLPAEFDDKLSASFDDGPVFVVFSYATPIAWITADGTMTVPDTRYSVTTTRHQSAARMAAAIVSGEYDRPTEWDAS